MYECSPCGEDFASLAAFDRHRVGRHMPLERRCLSVQEMSDVGLVRNDRGRWHDPERAAQVRKAFEKPKARKKAAADVSGISES
jgi:hypothetical protein